MKTHSPHGRSRMPLMFKGGAMDDGLEALSRSELIERLERLERLERALDRNELEHALDRNELERVDTFERVSPAVAYIQTSVVQQAPWAQEANEYPQGAGSGFVWDDEGHIVTNYHVVAGAANGRPGRGPVARAINSMPRKVTVSLPGCAEPVEAKVVGYEADKDLAVLKVDPAALTLTPLEIGSSADLKVGQSVLAVGNPFGLDFTLTTGIVSALGRDITGAGGRPIKDCVQTDAAINPGNSGGPLLDSRGRLIGVNTMIYAPGGMGGNVGIGFAIPVDTVARVVNQIITYGQDARPSIGVSVLPDQIRQLYSRQLRGRKLEGALVAEVVPGSPADKLGLRPSQRQFGGVLLGDMIVKAGDVEVKQNEDLLCAIEELEPGKAITLTVLRGADPARVEEFTLVPVQRKALGGDE